METQPSSRTTKHGQWSDNVHNSQLRYALRNKMHELIEEALRRRAYLKEPAP